MLCHTLQQHSNWVLNEYDEKTQKRKKINEIHIPHSMEKIKLMSEKQAHWISFINFIKIKMLLECHIIANVGPFICTLGNCTKIMKFKVTSIMAFTKYKYNVIILNIRTHILYHSQSKWIIFFRPQTNQTKTLLA